MKFNQRGFADNDEIGTDYGHTVRVSESSAASAPKVWLWVAGRVDVDPDTLSDVQLDDGRLAYDDGSAGVHLTLPQAKALAGQLGEMITYMEASERGFLG